MGSLSTFNGYRISGGTVRIHRNQFAKTVGNNVRRYEHNILDREKARRGDVSAVVDSKGYKDQDTSNPYIPAEYSTWTNYDANESNFNTEAAMRGAVYELKAQLLPAMFFTLLPVLWPLVLVIIGISLIQIFLVRFFERLSHHE